MDVNVFFLQLKKNFVKKNMELIKESYKKIKCNQNSVECDLECNECNKWLDITKEIIWKEDGWRFDNDLLCNDCYENKLVEIVEKKPELKIIDRLDYSVIQKPRIWKCKKCSNLLGGGCKWYLFDNNMDYCINCLPSQDELQEIYKNNSESPQMKYYKSLKKTTLGVDYKIESESIPLNVTQPNYEKMSSPFEIQPKLINEYIENNIYIDCIVNVNFNHSLLELILFYIDEPFVVYSTGLLVNGINQDIYSLVMDDHGRVSIDRIMTLEEYYKELNDYNNLTKEEIDEFGRINTDCPYVEFNTFSKYIRVKKGLFFYYG